MCSHESITWTITDNAVTDRMLENSLIHKFRQSRKIRKKTKLLNTEINKHCGVTNYLHYVELKTNVTRNLVKDTDTSDSSSLSDVDYDIIYNSSKRAKYKARNFQNYVSISEKNYESCNRRTIIHKEKSRNTERKVQVRRSPRLNPAVSEKCINTGWQEIINKNNSVLRKRSYTNVSNNKRNILKSNDCIHLKAQSNKESLSPQLDSQIGSTSSIMKSGNKYVRQNHEYFDTNTIDNKLSSEDNTISNKTKSVSKRKVQNKKDQSATINESNIELDSHGLHHHSSLLQSTSLENNTNADNELNSLVKSKDNKSTVVIENSINAKNCNSAYINYKPKLLKDVKRNLIPMIEKANSMNNSKDITDKNIGGELSYDQLLPDITNFDRHYSTPLKKIQTNVPNKDSSSDVLQDQQKDSGIDEDSQDKLVKKSNKTPINQNMEKITKKIFISSLGLKKTDEVFETMEDSEEIVKDPQFNDILREQINKEERTPSGEEEMKNSSQLNQINTNVETNEEDENSVKAKDSNDIQKQQLLSPKQDCMKEAHSKPCSLIQEEEDDRIINRIMKIAKDLAEEEKEEDISFQLKEDNANVDEEVPSINHKEKQNSKEEKESSGEKIKNFSQLNQIGTEIHSINHEDRTHFVKSENSLDVQQVLSPKENHIKDVHPKSNTNILDENNRQTNDEKEVNNFFQLNQVDKNTKRHLINQEDNTCMKQDTHDTQKHQTSLPKITSTEILNKKYKLIYKKNDVKSNIEQIDKIDSTNISDENPSTRKNILIHCPDIVDHNTDNLQETAVNEEEIETPMTLETDNEEDNMNYMSPQTKKRLQQLARLTLVVNSDSSESDDAYVITKTSQKDIDSSNMNHCSEDDNLSNDKINYAPKQTETDISCRENICIRKEATSAVEEVKLDLTNTKEDIKKTKSLISCTYENNDSLQSATNKNSLQEMPNCENVHNDNQSQENLIESLQLTVSDNDVSCNSKKSVNEFQKRKKSMLDKENICTKSNQNEEAISTEFKTRHESEHKQSIQASINTHLNSSCQYRSRNLQQLIEDQDLFVETIPASFTLTDLSEDEEAFILNIPSKVLQSNLQGQVLILKKKSIKLNESKYRIICKEIGTISCIFATGKKRKPYKIINIKNISTITVREKLPQDSRQSDVLNSNDTVSFVPKTLNKNQQTDIKRNSKLLKISNKKRKREESSDPET